MHFSSPGPAVEQAYAKYIGKKIEDVEGQIRMAWGSDVRVELPDHMYTADFVTSRLRVQVNGDGLVERILVG